MFVTRDDLLKSISDQNWDYFHSEFQENSRLAGERTVLVFLKSELNDWYPIYGYRWAKVSEINKLYAAGGRRDESMDSRLLNCRDDLEIPVLLAGKTSEF
jgi:hypothetical protein